MRWTLADQRFRSRLITQARIQPGHTVVDLGCGTGTLIAMIRQVCPESVVLGLDGDAGALDIARRKLASATSPGGATLIHALGDRPPLRPGSVDRVVSTLVLHHLDLETKRRVLAAAFDALRSGGEIHVADWGRPLNLAMRLAFLAVQLLDGFETTRHCVEDRLPALMREAGFVRVAEVDREATVFGTLCYYSAVRE